MILEMTGKVVAYGLSPARSRQDLEALRESATHHGYCQDEASREPVSRGENGESERPLEVCGAS